MLDVSPLDCDSYPRRHQEMNTHLSRPRGPKNVHAYIRRKLLESQNQYVLQMAYYKLHLVLMWRFKIYSDIYAEWSNFKPTYFLETDSVNRFLHFSFFTLLPKDPRMFQLYSLLVNNFPGSQWMVRPMSTVASALNLRASPAAVVFMSGSLFLLVWLFRVH
ncbi:uncharacterized protein LOC110839289 [Zootermopsis nevadensis]|uniref:uncharacterized protein LOC110839289 n=1 Tax=Zootermopsis nevadensis TaxID=136037 RepID=UPI000B8E7045|nr:uncharacterized protein LOC110839289 [Zootermopsis nevadensis]